ncbi:hypothetical protein ACGF3G_28985 [Streptomyces sp. NPDC048179]|uniref:hypothetical protein n=1 Tax=Streptomyces sp. NPDC048179 TaxID=3365506 RepID=UPI00371C7A6B
MSADRKNHDMTQAEADIALLLADATDAVEIGTAPVQAVLRGGRRRRTRRWAVATATAVAVLGGSTGVTLAFAGLPGEHHRTQVTAHPASPEARHVYEPQETELSRGTYQGKPWSVTLEVWGAPRDAEEAARQFDLMKAEGRELVVDTPDALVGKTSFFALYWTGSGRPQQVLFDSRAKLDDMRGTDLESGAVPQGGTGPDRLVIGKVARTAREVTCTWRDGRTTAVLSGPVNYRHNVPDPAIVPVAGYPAANWFVCVAPQGTSYQTAEVTK